MVYFLLYFRWRSSYQEGRVVIPLYGLSPPYFYTCPKPGPGFPTWNVVFLLCVFSELRCGVIVLCVFSELKCGVIVCFVDFGDIVDHHC